MTFTSYPNRKSKFNIKHNHISTTTRGTFSICETIVQIVNCQINIYQEGYPNLTFTSYPNRKSKFNIYKNHISTTAKGKFTIFTPLYRSLIVKIIITERWPQIRPLLPVQTGSQSLILEDNHISTGTCVKFAIFTPWYSMVKCQKIITERWPQFDLYVPVQTGSWKEDHILEAMCYAISTWFVF